MSTDPFRRLTIPLALWVTVLASPPLAEGSGASSGIVSPPTPKTIIQALRLNTPVNLDGILSEPSWQEPSASPLIQNDPDNGTAPRQRTDWWIAFDNEALYLAARMHDAAPESIDCDLGRRDSWPNSDWVFLNLDTFNDDRNGYSFAISPSGTIIDAILYNDGWDDSSWDAIWECATTIDELGWTVEARIPFSQLKFPNQAEQVWGINFSRRTRRYRERDELFHMPRGESGYVGRFPDLVGIRGIDPGNRLEVLTYGVVKAEYLDIDAGNPFEDSSEFEGNLGADIRWGLSNDLSLYATVNPDFGQVEVDPAVVNLSDCETFYSERRPFFVEDANTFRFGREGTNNNWNFNWMDPMLFYSRRIGHAPDLSLKNHDHAEVPSFTTILGAGKLSGKLGGASAGLLSAFTAEERAHLDTSGKHSSQVVEPLTNYTVMRLQRTRPDGHQGLGIIATSTWRDLTTARSKEELSRHALTGGIDGWTTLDDDEVWALRGYVSGSYVTGTETVIDALQRSSRHYYQRDFATSKARLPHDLGAGLRTSLWVDAPGVGNDAKVWLFQPERRYALERFTGLRDHFLIVITSPVWKPEPSSALTVVTPSSTSVALTRPIVS